MRNSSVCQPQIVVITTEGDFHLTYIQPHLKSPLIVIDPLSLIEGNTLTYELDKKRHRVIVTHNGIVLDNVSSVWVRKPQAINKNTLPLKEEYRSYGRAALEVHFKQLYAAFQDSLWVSDNFAHDKANNKTYQLAVASKLGFQVPDTVVTSDKSVAKAFIERHGRVIMKSLPHFKVELDGQHKVLFAMLIDKDDIPALDTLYVSPLIFQQAIDAAYDVRVTVVQGHVFPARISTTNIKSSSRIRDYRIGTFEGDMSVEVIDDFPKAIADLCVRHTQNMGLQFGAIDLVVDKEGTYWFLENNPNGQWGFVERMTGQQIGKTFAEMLFRGNSYRG